MVVDTHPKRLGPPTHRVFYVEPDRDGREGRWLELGAAWQHPDGEGLEIFLDVLPIGGFRGRLRVKPVSFRPPHNRPTQQDDEE